MPPLRRVLPFVLLVVLMPASASAQGFFRWLGRLSGPGPFWGASAEFALQCYGVNEKAKPEIPVKGRVAGVGVRVPCKDALLTDRHATVYLIVQGGIADDNPLFYGDQGEAESAAVRLLKSGVSLDWTVHKSLDVGAGFGLMYFAGPRFDNFSRGYVQPARVAFRPLTLRGTDDADGWLILAANWQMILGRIDGPDFGAPLDPLVSRNEQDVEVGATVDLVRFIRKFISRDRDAYRRSTGVR